MGEDFIGKSNVALILGDNFFYAQNLSTNLINSAKLTNGAKVLLHKVAKPELFGVAKINNKNSEMVEITLLSKILFIIKISP